MIVKLIMVIILINKLKVIKIWQTIRIQWKKIMINNNRIYFMITLMYQVIIKTIKIKENSPVKILQGH